MIKGVHLMKKKEVINGLQMYMIHLVMLIVFW